MKLYNYAESCAKQFTLIDLGLLKFCVCSAGIIAGLLTPRKNKKSVMATASIVFSLSLFPLMFKFVKIIASQDRLQ